jgi:hypothetical protein
MMRFPLGDAPRRFWKEAAGFFSLRSKPLCDPPWLIQSRECAFDMVQVPFLHWISVRNASQTPNFVSVGISLPERTEST